MPSPFEYIKSINETGADLMGGDPQAEKEYTPFLINRGLSFTIDTILYANEMNRYSSIPKSWQFQFLLNSITKKKRYGKWQKKDASPESLDLVMRYYGYNSEKAKDALKILTTEQLNIIKERLDKGGKR